MNGKISDLPEKEALEALEKGGFSDPNGALKNLRLLSETPLKASLGLVMNSAALSPSPTGALNNLEMIVKDMPAGLCARLFEDEETLKRLIFIAGSSPYLSNIISQNPDWLERLFAGGLEEKKAFGIFRAELAALMDGLAGVEAVSKALRQYKRKEYLRIGAKDLLRAATLEETTAELSDLAGASLDEAVGLALKELKKSYGEPLCADGDGAVKEAEFAVMGLGKLGGRELNFSSDVDIIYIYSSDDGETSGVEGRTASKISLHAFFVKLSAMVTKMIGSVTEDGFVFRIDLDLRPEGRSGAMANSLRSAEIYYESWGQSWERAALLKARPVAGSMRLGEEFLDMVRPFVFRRHLDFTALEEIKSMKEKIDLSLLKRSPDAIDVKLGPGGIREIEFFCQALQLINAGKDPALRERNTLKAVESLLAKGRIKAEEAAILKDGYVFLRDLEHRIQIVEGRQSQVIPAHREELERLARMMGLKDSPDKSAGEAFWEEYRLATSRVHDVYRSLFYRSEEPLAVEAPVLEALVPGLSEDEARARLKALGFKDPAEAERNLSLLRSGPALARLNARSRLILQGLAPRLLSLAVKTADADSALRNIERFFSAVGARSAFYSLLSENPLVVEKLVEIFGSSVFLSRSLIERPETLDMLLSRELSMPYRPRSGFVSLLNEVKACADYEERLDKLRTIKAEEVFRIGVNDVLGALTPRQVSSQITFLAEACLQSAYETALGELERSYGPPGARFAVIGLGKLGGRDLIYGSDLDIIFVYSDGVPDEDVHGPKSISAHEFFVKLGQRIISALTLRTKEGVVFSVDTRLRPSGSSGPLVVSRSAFLGYHRDKTLVWERQAFIKARSVAGDAAFGDEVLRELKEALYAKPLTAEDVEEMLRIRKRMELEIAREGAERLNIKTGKGGLVDIEFLVQALQLRHGRENPGLATPATLKAIKRLFKCGVLSKDDSIFLKNAFSFLRLLEKSLRIVNDRPEGDLVAGSIELNSLARRLGYKGPAPDEGLLEDYSSQSARVRGLYLKTLERLKEAP